MKAFDSEEMVQRNAKTRLGVAWNEICTNQATALKAQICIKKQLLRLRAA
jgi:hypothetical protein